jgi:3-hydroxyisobutyrate dehydrogenase
MSEPGLRVCVLGTGIMGAPIARNLAGAGFRVSAWNRTASRAEALAEYGIVPAATPLAAAEGCDILLTMLADAAGVEEAVGGGVLDALASGALWLQMATVGTEIERLAELARDADVQFLDAPVLGSAGPAADGTLLALLSGERAAMERAGPLLDAISSRSLWVGEDAGAASRLKLVLNHWILALLGNLTETLGLAVTLGVDPDLFLDAIRGGLLDSPYAQMRSAGILAESFEPSFRAGMARKDVALIERALDGTGVELALIAAVGAQLDRAIALGYGDADAAASFLASVAPDPSTSPGGPNAGS